MKNLIITGLLSVVLGFVAGCGESQKSDSGGAANASAASAPPAAASTAEVAVMKTTDGDMVFEFWSDVAPKTVENFKTLAKKGFYDGTAFHRIVKGFMIQGGDPLTKDPAKAEAYGTGGPGYTIPDEFHNRPHTRGVISMAHSGAPNSGGSQFFICLDEAAVTPLNGKYAAFGKLVKGDDVLEKIANTQTTGPNAMGEMAIPVNRVEIQSIKIVPADSIK